MVLLTAVVLCAFLCAAVVSALRRRWTAAAVSGLMAIVCCLAGLLHIQGRQRAAEQARLLALRKRIERLEKGHAADERGTPRSASVRPRPSPSAPVRRPERATPTPPRRLPAAPPAVVEETVPAPEPEAPGTPFRRLVIEYPKPLYIGAPKDLMRKHKLRDPWLDVGTMLVPVSTHLISRGRPVTASDSEPVVGELSYVTDGDKEGSDGSYVELGTGPQSVRIDLGDLYHVHAVVVWHYHSQPRAYHDVVVLLSSDEEAAVPSVIFNNDVDDSLGFGKGEDPEYIETARGRLISAGGPPARYVWLYSNGSTASEMNHYVEVEVYGEGPVK